MKKILVVDDEKNIRSVIREYAEFSGSCVEEAEDEEDFFARLANG